MAAAATAAVTTAAAAAGVQKFWSDKKKYETHNVITVYINIRPSVDGLHKHYDSHLRL